MGELKYGGVAVWGSHSVREWRQGRFAVWAEGCCVGKLRCEGITICVSCGVWLLQFVQIALCGCCSGEVSVQGSCCETCGWGSSSLCEEVVVCERKLRCVCYGVWWLLCIGIVICGS